MDLVYLYTKMKDLKIHRNMNRIITSTNPTKAYGVRDHGLKEKSVIKMVQYQKYHTRTDL